MGSGLKSEAAKYFQDIADEMEYYEVLVKNQGQFTSREDFFSKYAGKDGWGAGKAAYSQAAYAAPIYKQEVAHTLHSHGGVAPLELNKAKPFVRAVIERMLDLLQSEDNWIKHAAAQNATGAQVPAESDEATAWCLIGAQARALHDLSIAGKTGNEEIDLARQRVMGAVDRFLKEMMKKENNVMALPTWNDSAHIEFEDIRLWLKSCLGALDDIDAD